MRLALFTLLALTLSAYAGEKGDGKEDLKKLQGTWKVVALEADGKAQPKEKSPKEIVIEGKKLTGLGPEMTVTLDPGKKPKWVDLTFKREGKLYPVRAIYEVRGDELKVCIPLAEKGKLFENKRPTGFETKGKAVMLLKARRAEKGK